MGEHTPLDIEVLRMKHFSDFSKEAVALDGDKVKLDSILNQEITITGHAIKRSKFDDNSGKCLTVQFEMDGLVQIFFTGSEVLKDQLEKYEAEIPFMTTIKKINRYYTLT